MIKTIGDLERQFTVAKGGAIGTTALKSVMNTSGVETFTLISSHRYSANEKIDPKVATEFLKKHGANLARIPVNASSTDLYVRLK